MKLFVIHVIITLWYRETVYESCPNVRPYYRTTNQTTQVVLSRLCGVGCSSNRNCISFVPSASVFGCLLINLKLSSAAPLCHSERMLWPRTSMRRVHARRGIPSQCSPLPPSLLLLEFRCSISFPLPLHFLSLHLLFPLSLFQSVAVLSPSPSHSAHPFTPCFSSSAYIPKLFDFLFKHSPPSRTRLIGPCVELSCQEIVFKSTHGRYHCDLSQRKIFRI